MEIYLYLLCLVFLIIGGVGFAAFVRSGQVNRSQERFEQ